MAGILILAEFGHAFGLYTLSGPQQDSLGKVVTWAFQLIGRRRDHPFRPQPRAPRLMIRRPQLELGAWLTVTMVLAIGWPLLIRKQIRTWR